MDVLSCLFQLFLAGCTLAGLFFLVKRRLYLLKRVAHFLQHLFDPQNETLISWIDTTPPRELRTYFGGNEQLLESDNNRRGMRPLHYAISIRNYEWIEALLHVYESKPREVRFLVEVKVEDLILACRQNFVPRLMNELIVCLEKISKREAESLLPELKTYVRRMSRHGLYEDDLIRMLSALEALFLENSVKDEIDQYVKTKQQNIKWVQENNRKALLLGSPPQGNPDLPEKKVL